MKNCIISILFLLTLLTFVNSAYCINLYGKVSNESDNAVAYAIVILIQNDVEIARAITGNDGFFFIRNISNGTYSVRIKSGDQLHEKPDIIVNDSIKNLDFKINKQE